MLRTGRKHSGTGILIILLSAFTCCACSKSAIYQIKCDDRLIEKRNYQNGKLQSIVAYNCTDTKDSIIFKDEVVWFHYGDNGFSLEKDVPFQKFYYPCFDKSLGDRDIYRMVKSQILLEDVLWSLAAIDDELNSDHILLSDNKRIVAMNDVCNIEYTNIDSNIMLYGLFELYNTEILHSLKILIKEGLLYKLIFTGEKTRQVVDFEYENSILAKEIIYFYDIRTGKCSFTQDYSFELVESAGLESAGQSLRFHSPVMNSQNQNFMF